MNTNIKTIELTEGLESITINRYFVINKELGYYHIGFFLKSYDKTAIDKMLGNQMPLTNKFKFKLFNVGQWAQQNAFIRFSIPILKRQVFTRYISGACYDLDVANNIIYVYDTIDNNYRIVYIGIHDMYALYQYKMSHQLQLLDESIVALVHSYKPSLKAKVYSFIKNLIK